MKPLIAAAALSVCATLVAGCGDSRHVSAASDRAAIVAAQRDNGYLLAFPAIPGTRACRIPMGGPPPGRIIAGQCSTGVSQITGDSVRINFVERSHNGKNLQSGGWTVLVDRHNRVASVSVHGWVPQLVR